MAIHGNLATMTVSELLQWAGGNGKTGLLRLEQDGVATKLFFEEGLVCACLSDDPPYLMGQFLLFHGVITERILRSAMAEQQCSGRSLSEVLVELNAVTHEDLDRWVARKAEETILSLFHWTDPDAMFWFRENTRPGPTAMRVDLDVRTLLLRGAKRADELARVREAYPSGAVSPERTGEAPTPEEIGDFASYQVYLAVNGERSIQEIALLVHGSEFQVARRLLALERSGVVRSGEKSLFPLQRAPLAAPDSPPDADFPPDAESSPQPEASPTPSLEPAADLPLESETPLESVPELVLESASQPPPAEPEPTVVLSPEEPDREVRTEGGEEEGTETGDSSLDLGCLDLDGPSPSLEDSESEEEAGDPEAVVAEPDEVAEEPVPAVPIEAELVDAAAAEEASEVIEVHLQKAREHAENSEPEAALGHLERAREVDPGHPSISSVRAGAESAIVERFLSNGLRPDRVPAVIASPEDLAQAQMTPAQEYLLGQANGEWDIQALLSVAPLRPVELLSALHGLVMRGLVELREPGK